MTTLGLLQNNSKVAPPKIEALLNLAGNGQFCAVAGYAIILAVDPHVAGSVVNLEDAAAQCPKRSAHVSRNRDFLAYESAGILVDLGDAGARGAACQ